MVGAHLLRFTELDCESPPYKGNSAHHGQKGMTIFWVAEREREKGRLDFSSSWIVPLSVASHMNPTMIITTEKKYKSGHYRTEVKPLLGIPTLHPE